MISVVIPAFNEEKFIGKCLQALANQKTKKKFEVIVVDNNSSDKTVSVARKFTKRLSLRIVQEPMQGRGPARAKGMEKAKGEIIFSTDADSIVPPNWIETLSSYFNDKRVVAVTGPWEQKDVAGVAGFVLNHLQEMSELPFRIIFGHYWLTGFNFAVRKKAYESCGGFDKGLNMHEDIDLTIRLRKYGKIAYCRQACVLTSGRRFKHGLIKGLWEYQREGIKYFLFGNKNVYLDNKR